MPLNLTLDQMRQRRRERKWNEKRRLRGRIKQEKAILRGIRSEDKRVFPYDDPCVHDKEASWEPPDYLNETLIDEENDKKVADLLGAHTPWDDVDSDCFDPEGKPQSWYDLEDEHADRVWRAVASWTERARQESWPTDQGDIS